MSGLSWRVLIIYWGGLGIEVGGFKVASELRGALYEITSDGPCLLRSKVECSCRVVYRRQSYILRIPACLFVGGSLCGCPHTGVGASEDMFHTLFSTSLKMRIRAKFSALAEDL